ncbi:MAG: hypothetical protein WDN28_17600 [Chthoniobacter sp.]
MKPSDMFPSGVVALAQAAEYPQVVIEHVYTAPARNAAAIRANLQTGDEIKLERYETTSRRSFTSSGFPTAACNLRWCRCSIAATRRRWGAGRFSLERRPR